MECLLASICLSVLLYFGIQFGKEMNPTSIKQGISKRMKKGHQDGQKVAIRNPNASWHQGFRPLGRSPSLVPPEGWGKPATRRILSCLVPSCHLPCPPNSCLVILGKALRYYKYSTFLALWHVEVFKDKVWKALKSHPKNHLKTS